MFKKLSVKKPQFRAPKRNEVRHLGRKKSLVAKDVGDLSWLDSLGIGNKDIGNGSPSGSDEGSF